MSSQSGGVCTCDLESGPDSCFVHRVSRKSPACSRCGLWQRPCACTLMPEVPDEWRAALHQLVAAAADLRQYPTRDTYQSVDAALAVARRLLGSPVLEELR